MSKVVKNGDRQMTIKEFAEVLGCHIDDIADPLCVSSKYCNTPLDDTSLVSPFDIIIALIEESKLLNKEKIEFYELLQKTKAKISEAANNKEGINIPKSFTNLSDFEFINNLPQNQHKSCEGFVYISTDNSGFYKIGRTKGLSRREQSLKCGNIGYRTIASVYTQNCITLELILHRLFSDKRIEREWFELNGDDLYILFNYFGFSQEIGEAA